MPSQDCHKDGSGSVWVCRRELERVEVLAEVVFKCVIIYEVYEIDHNSKKNLL